MWRFDFRKKPRNDLLLLSSFVRCDCCLIGDLLVCFVDDRRYRRRPDAEGIGGAVMPFSRQRLLFFDMTACRFGTKVPSRQRSAGQRLGQQPIVVGTIGPVGEIGLHRLISSSAAAAALVASYFFASAASFILQALSD